MLKNYRTTEQILLLLMLALVLTYCSENNNSNDSDSTAIDTFDNSPVATRRALSTTVYLSPSEKMVYYQQNTLNEDNLDLFKPLIEQLEEDGFQREYLKLVFRQNRVENIPWIMLVNLGIELPQEQMIFHTSGYLPSTVTTSGDFEDGNQFMQEFSDKLSDVEKKYAVPAEVVAAILWVETYCGQYLGLYPVFNTYASMALFQDKQYTNEQLQHYASVTGNLQPARYLNRASQKAAWAYDELKALLTIDLNTHVSILQLKGSYAGAFGIPQFIPSSYLRFARDGNSDGLIDIFNYYDAIESVGYYLAQAGWDNSDQQRIWKAILAYNHSMKYLLNVATFATMYNDNCPINMELILNEVYGAPEKAKKPDDSKKKHREQLKAELKRQLRMQNLSP